MFIDGGQNFEVLIEEFAKRHFIKRFRKKYKKAWDITENAIIGELQRIDNIIGCNDFVEIVRTNNDIKLLKLYFKIAGTDQSKKGSGNRVVAAADLKTRKCRVLLVYSKNDICSPNETTKWQKLVKENYSDSWNSFFN